MLGRARARGEEIVFAERGCAGVFGFREVSFWSAQSSVLSNQFKGFWAVTGH